MRLLATRGALIGTLLLFAVSLTGCGHSVDSEAQEIVTAFSDGDAVSITECIFGEGEESPVIDSILENTTIELKDTDKESVIYHVTAKDMSGIFEGGFFDDIENMTDDEILTAIAEYEGETVESDVEVSYQKNEDGEIVFDYASEKFLDAVTGGFVSAYAAQYEQYIETIRGIIEGGN